MSGVNVNKCTWYLQVLLYFCTVKRKEIFFRSDCPINKTLDILGDKWSLLIVRDLMFKGKNTYGDFLNGGEGITTSVLADKLALLECGGIITKEVHPESKAKILYKLTQKGIDLIPVLVEVIAWSEKYHEVHPQATVFAKELKKNKEGVIKMLRKSLK